MVHLKTYFLLNFKLLSIGTFVRIVINYNITCNIVQIKLKNHENKMIYN